MTQTDNNPWLTRLAVATALATFGLICVGGLVTSHGAGMAVPDWPTTYGEHMFLFPTSKWVGGVFYEHSHRLFASLVGLLTAGLTGWIWARETRGRARWVGLGAIAATLGLMGVRTQGMFVALAVVAVGVIGWSLFQIPRAERPIRWWAAIAFSVVLIQGVLGGLRVTALKDELGIFHGTLAQLFLVLVVAIAVVLSRGWRRAEKLPVYDRAGLRYFFAFTTAMILLQLILGATMRHQHAGLAIPDFPTAYGKWWPDLDADAITRYNASRNEIVGVKPITAAQVGLQMVHRIGAVLILAAVAWTAWVARRQLGGRSALTKFSLVWLGLILAQATLGVLTVLQNKPVDVATAHVAVGALSLVTGAMLTLTAMRLLPKPVREAEPFSGVPQPTAKLPA